MTLAIDGVADDTFAPPAAAPRVPVVHALAAAISGGTLPADVRDDLLLEAAREHRVQLLLTRVLDPGDAREGRLKSALAGEYRHAAAHEAIGTAGLRRFLVAASARGVRPLIVKGTALAYTVYERPWERPRTDTDVYIRVEDADAVRGALEDAGYEPAIAVDGDLVTAQWQYVRDAAGVHEQVDVHTRLFNPAVFAGALPWDDANARAVAIEKLAPGAWTLCSAHALFVACVHRVAHHNDADDLIWLYDIDRLARTMDEAGWRLLADAARQARAVDVCRSGLDRAAGLFGTPWLPRLLPAPRVPEPSRAFLGGGLTELDVQRLNLRHLPRWRDRARLIAQHAFPSPRYMRARHGARGPVSLAWSYARRLLVGIPRWCRPGPRPPDPRVPNYPSLRS